MITDFLGYNLYENPLLTDTEEYQVTVTLAFKQRWLEPILHPFTLPFQPWVKTRIETRTRQVPSQKVWKTRYGLHYHPILKDRLFGVFNGP